MIGMGVDLISDEVINQYDATVVRELAAPYSYLLPAIALLSISFAVRVPAHGHRPAVDALQ